MVVTSQVLPAVRVMVARDLIQVYELKPTTVASKMGVTPAAVTQYVSGVRGGKTVHILSKSKRVKRLLEKLVQEVLRTQVDQCAVIALLCEVCRVAREERMLCQMCDISAAAGGEGECNICSRLRCWDTSVPTSEH